MKMTRKSKWQREDFSCNPQGHDEPNLECLLNFVAHFAKRRRVPRVPRESIAPISRITRDRGSLGETRRPG